MATPLQQQPPAILSAPLNMQTLGNMVRHWVHFDTQVAQFNKEASASRASKDFYEHQILAALKTAQYETAVIQIAGGRILVNEERHNQSLTFKSLEEMLHEYIEGSLLHILGATSQDKLLPEPSRNLITLHY